MAWWIIRFVGLALATVIGVVLVYVGLTNANYLVAAFGALLTWRAGATLNKQRATVRVTQPK